MKKPPLLLLHGICNNANLFAIEGHGLGHYLSRFFDIYPISYPLTEHRDQPWDFDFHLNQDMPLIWRQVCNEAGEKPFVFGYSMGGMLAMAAQAQGIIDAPAIVTAGAPFSFPRIPIYPPLMRAWVKIASLTGYRTVPVKLLARLLCIVFAAAAPPERMHDINLFRYLIKTATVNVPVETFIQALNWMRTRNFTDRSGTINYPDHFANIHTPVCLIYGSDDRIAPQRSVDVGYAAVSSPRKAIVGIPGGTHLSMTVGPQAAAISELARAWCCKSEEDED
ncbi:MAG: alpha/beta hydrolase [Candidatus Riflebacteria bacterium]|nr:alpha/beta hydrolase [Candidatus Riflebacteria bacterium]